MLVVVLVVPRFQFEEDPAPGGGHRRVFAAQSLPANLVQGAVGGGIFGGEVEQLRPLGAGVPGHVTLREAHPGRAGLVRNQGRGSVEALEQLPGGGTWLMGGRPRSSFVVRSIPEVEYMVWLGRPERG